MDSSFGNSRENRHVHAGMSLELANIGSRKIVLACPFTENTQVPTRWQKAGSGPSRLVGARPLDPRPLSFDFDLDERVARSFVAVDSVQLIRGQSIEDAVDVVLGIGHDARERGLNPRNTRQIEDQSVPSQAGRFPGEDHDPPPSQDHGTHVRPESEVVNRLHFAAAGSAFIRPSRKPRPIEAAR